MNEFTAAVLITAAIFTLPAWFILFYSFQSRRKWAEKQELERARTTGVIVDYRHETVRRYKGGISHRTRPIVEYTAEGRRHGEVYEESLSPKEFPVGMSVEVLYDPDHPEHFHIESDPYLPKAASTLFRIGIIWLVVASAVAFGMNYFLKASSPAKPRAEKTVVLNKVNPPSDPAKAYQYSFRQDSTLTIEGYTGSEEDLTIPTQLDGHIVRAITTHAFGRTPMRRLTVPGTISSIPMAAFAGCLALQEVHLEEGVERIGAHAFSFCLVLDEVWLPASLHMISKEVFPDDCNAKFHVHAGSRAEEYCQMKGYETVVEP